jgi:uncharacterized protein
MGKLLRQFAALPVMATCGSFQVLLVTSRGGGRWIIPKGNPERRVNPSDVAAHEALEEAGVAGEVLKLPIGRYKSAKQFPSGRLALTEIIVFRLNVSQHLADWKEDTERKRLWVPLSQAADFVDDGGLADFLRQLSL